MIMAVSEGTSGAGHRPMSAGPTFGGPTLRQPTFDCNSTDKCAELRNVRLKVNSTLQSYNVNNTKITIIKNCLGRQGIQFIETLTHVEQEISNTEDGLFILEVSNKCCPQQNEMMKFLQCCKLSRQSSERQRNG